MAKSTELLQAQLDATFWESNYCKQRAIVLHIQGQQLNEELEKIKKEKKTKEEEANAKTNGKNSGNKAFKTFTKPVEEGK